MSCINLGDLSVTTIMEQCCQVKSKSRFGGFSYHDGIGGPLNKFIKKSAIPGFTFSKVRKRCKLQLKYWDHIQVEGESRYKM